VRDECTLNPGERDYLDAITAFVEAYDDEHYRIDTSRVTPRQLLEFMMEQHGITQSDLATLLGSKVEASFLLSGRRNPSRAQCVVLGKKFGIEPGLFFAADVGRAAKRRKAS
jgi:HTH-type transcriptional regulator/antitoxin HigA